MTEELIIETPEEILIIDVEKLRYPIGHFHFDETLNPDTMEAMIKDIEEFPGLLKKAVAQYSESQLNNSYREGGWSIRQVIHHLADSHMNGYIRFKLALSEDRPTIKPYNEKLWAEMIDTMIVPVSVSVAIIENVHKRWSALLRAMNTDDFNRQFFHPQNMKMHSLTEYLALYSWHGKHHLAHISLVPADKQPGSKKKKQVKATATKSAAKKSIVSASKKSAKKPARK